MKRLLSIKVKGNLREHLSPRFHHIYSQQDLMLKEEDLCLDLDLFCTSHISNN